MRKLELKDILRHLECNVQRRCCDENGNITFEIWTVQELLSTFGVEHLPLDRLKLILRPMSDLTKPITVKGYNDDKEFIPFLELAENRFPNIEWELDDYGCHSKVNSNIQFQRDGNVYFMRIYKPRAIDINGNLVWERVLISPVDSLTMIDLLNQWQFDCRGLISEGLAKDYNTIK